MSLNDLKTRVEGATAAVKAMNAELAQSVALGAAVTFGTIPDRPVSGSGVLGKVPEEDQWEWYTDPVTGQLRRRRKGGGAGSSEGTRGGGGSGSGGVIGSTSSNGGGSGGGGGVLGSTSSSSGGGGGGGGGGGSERPSGGPSYAYTFSTAGGGSSGPGQITSPIVAAINSLENTVRQSAPDRTGLALRTGKVDW